MEEQVVGQVEDGRHEWRGKGFAVNLREWREWFSVHFLGSTCPSCPSRARLLGAVLSLQLTSNFAGTLTLTPLPPSPHSGTHLPLRAPVTRRPSSWPNAFGLVRNETVEPSRPRTGGARATSRTRGTR